MDGLRRLKTYLETCPPPTNGQRKSEDLARPDACALCEDVGFRDRGDGVYTDCECRLEKARQLKAGVAAQMFENAGIPKKHCGAQLDQLALSHPDVRTMVKVAQGYQESMPDRPFLVLCGPNGNGKSHTAAAIANGLLEIQARLIMAGEKENAVAPVFWAYCPRFVERLQRGQFEGEWAGKAYFDLMERACTVPLLVVDDFGLYKESPWADLQMDKVIGERYDAERATVITTNLLPKNMPPRLRSRVQDTRWAKVVINEAPDYRLKERG